jgi:hypothetical protein
VEGVGINSMVVEAVEEFDRFLAVSVDPTEEGSSISVDCQAPNLVV